MKLVILDANDEDSWGNWVISDDLSLVINYYRSKFPNKYNVWWEYEQNNLTTAWDFTKNKAIVISFPEQDNLIDTARLLGYEVEKVVPIGFTGFGEDDQPILRKYLEDISK